MRPSPRVAKAGKRPVNLTLSSDLVERARALTNNLSGVVEELLTAFVAHEHEAHVSRATAARKAAEAWNEFGDQHGSFANEHSTL